MELHILENGLNSLDVGLKFYEKFVNDDIDSIDISVEHYGDLKFSVISIHSTIELLTKEILKNINEFLIFELDIEKDDTLCEMLYRQYKEHKKSAHIDYWSVFLNGKYKTIDYNKCIKILGKIFREEISQNDIETLQNLALYRNALTHLGYASTFDWYKILVTLEGTFEILDKFYFNHIRDKNEKYNELTKQIKAILSRSKANTMAVWLASKEIFLTSYEDYLDNLFEEMNMKIVDESLLPEEQHLYNTVTLKKDGKEYIIYFKYSYVNECIFLLNSKNIIVSVICIDDFNLDYYENADKLKSLKILEPKQEIVYDEDKKYKLYTIRNSIPKSDENKIYELNSESLEKLMKYYIVK